jgi:hypothetical protein
MAIAAPRANHLEGCSDGMPRGSSGKMPVNFETFWMYASVLFSDAGAQRRMMVRMVYNRYL